MTAQTPTTMLAKGKTHLPERFVCENNTMLTMRMIGVRDYRVLEDG